MRSNESGLKFSAESAPALFASRNTGYANSKPSRMASVYRSGTVGHASAWTCTFGQYLTGAKYALIEYQIQWTDRVSALNFYGCTVISETGYDGLGVNSDNTNVYVKTALITDITSIAYFTETFSGNGSYRGINVIGIYV